MRDTLDLAYWTLYRRLQRIDRRFLKRGLLRLGTPRDIERRVVTIKSGVGRGLKWQHRDGYSHFFWTGTYDHDMQQAMKRYIKRGQVVYDVGGNAGFHALLLARLVGPRGRVFCFEPLPENIDMIRCQLALNPVPWCDVVAAAVSDQVGTADLFAGSSNAVATLIDRGGALSARVDTVTLDSFSRENPLPDAIKMDIEGAEIMALAGAREMLARRVRPIFFFEFHGLDCVRAVTQVLGEHDYRYESLSGEPMTPADLPARGQAVALPG